MASRRPRKRRERSRRTAAQWLVRLTGGDAKEPAQLSPDFVLWVLAGLLAHLDRRGDSHLADLAAGALVHGASLAAHDGAGWQRGGPAHQAALRTIAQAFADLDLSRGRRRDDAGAWALLNSVDAAYTGLCVGLKPDGSASDRDYLDEEMQHLGRKDLRTTLRRRLLNLALEEVARTQLKARATERAIRARSRDMRRRLQRAGLLKLVGGSASFISPEGTEL
jgi:hypothetical protein